MEVTAAVETTWNWFDLPEPKKHEIIIAYLVRINLPKTKYNDLRRVFNIGNPDIILTTQDGTPACRVAEKSVQPMLVLFKNYIL